MKTIGHTATLLLFAVLLVTSCVPDPPVPIPDLNPDTPEGSDILIDDIGDLITYSSISISGSEPPRFQNFFREYDIFNDGTFDLSLTGDDVSGGGLFSNPNCYVRMRFTTSEVLVSTGIPVFNDIFNMPKQVVWLPQDALIGGSMPQGAWASANEAVWLMAESRIDGFGPWHLLPPPAGLQYIATRTFSGGQYYYGWIEVVTSDHEDPDPNEFVLMSRFGLSTTPGLRVRMGQE